jgi:hypothetical protein
MDHFHFGQKHLIFGKSSLPPRGMRGGSILHQETAGNIQERFTISAVS